MRKRKRSSVTGWLSGAPCSFQSGKSSASARGSITAPDRMCAPTSEPFSTTQTENPRRRAARELLQPDRRGEPRGAGAHDHDVVLHRFTFGHGVEGREAAREAAREAGRMMARL